MRWGIILVVIRVVWRAYLTDSLWTFMMSSMRRAISFVLALVVVVCLPLRHADVSDPETSRPATAGSAQTERPSQAAGLAAPMIAATAGTWQVRLTHEGLASAIWSPRLPDYSLSASVSPARFRLPGSHPLRTFPLLI